MDINYYKQYEPLFGAWHITRVIGEGSYGTVFEIEREDFGVTYKAALKAITIPKSRSDLQNAMSEGMDEESVSNYFRGFVEELTGEIALMDKLKGNSNVVNYDDHIVIEHQGEIGWDILIRMELLTPLNLYLQERGGRISEEEAIRLGIDISRALELCEKNKILHRDVKPENIFHSKLGSFKLGDFGIARIAEKTTGASTRVGTGSYMAPEIYRGESYGATVDVYSLGLVLYRLMNNGRLPFLPQPPQPITHSLREQAQSQRLSGLPMPQPVNAGAAFAQVILKAASFKEEDRYQSAAELSGALEGLLTESVAREGDAQRAQDAGAAAGNAGVLSADGSPAMEYHTARLSEEKKQQTEDMENEKTSSVWDSAPVPEAPKTVAEPQKKKSLIPIIAGVAAVLVIGIVAAVVLLSGGSDRSSGGAPSVLTQTGGDASVDEQTGGAASVEESTGGAASAAPDSSIGLEDGESAGEYGVIYHEEIINAIVNTDNVNVREAPYRSASRVTTLSPGTSVVVVGETSSYSGEKWCLIRYDKNDPSKEGYIFAEFLTSEDELPEGGPVPAKYLSDDITNDLSRFAYALYLALPVGTFESPDSVMECLSDDPVRMEVLLWEYFYRNDTSYPNDEGPFVYCCDVVKSDAQFLFNEMFLSNYDFSKLSDGIPEDTSEKYVGAYETGDKIVVWCEPFGLESYHEFSGYRDTEDGTDMTVLHMRYEMGVENSDYEAGQIILHLESCRNSFGFTIAGCEVVK